MSASMTFLMLVISGAVLFFAAGYLVRLLMSADSVVSRKENDAIVAAAEHRLAQAAERVRALESELLLVRDELEVHQKELERLREENAQMFEEETVVEDADAMEFVASESVTTEAADPAEETDNALQEEISALKRSAGEAEKRASRASVSLEISKEEVRKLKKENHFLKKSEKTAQQSEKKLEELSEKLKEAELKIAGVSKLEKENRYLRKEVQHLSSQSTSAKGSKGTAKASTLALKKSFDTEMKEIIADLLELDQVKTAVLTDTSGALIGGVGDSAAFDGLAVLCGKVGDIGQDDENIPLGGLRVVHLKDHKDGIAAFRTFTKNKETYVLATLGNNSPPEEGILELTVCDLADEA